MRLHRNVRKAHLVEEIDPIATPPKAGLTPRRAVEVIFHDEVKSKDPGIYTGYTVQPDAEIQLGDWVLAEKKNGDLKPVQIVGISEELIWCKFECELFGFSDRPL